MKLALSVALLSGLASASASSVIQGDAARKLMAKSVLRRKLEEEEADEEAEEEEYAWMQNYQVKFVGCTNDMFQNQENGEYESGSVVYRLCAASDECDVESRMGCSEAYGDYVVGINTYTQAIGERMEEAANNGRRLSKKVKVNGKGMSMRRLEEEEFNLQEFAECGRIEVEDDEDENDADEDAEEEEEVEYFVGPACAEDGSDVVLSMYSDEDCLYSSEVTFYELAGMELPYSSGGIASSYCDSCVEQDDDGNVGTSEFCMGLKEASGGCDEYDQSQCDLVEQLQSAIKAESKSGGGMAIFLWILFALALVGGGWWFFKVYKAKKAASGVDTTPISGAMS
eukprot:CAMPEP_0113552180 /NCGR_PEP_ID=MMETSP0015_2-20120614/14926_1 /TAXON_ID=2838 /ORGANISM="Odontella" /LENGTH=340 /DNA_ID=CAMNT_0000453133 /DNA_START=112 /DNA_END=1134 /DNA_ORIENTATION=+ /assembly_acc=CAM_ASM_000160